MKKQILIPTLAVAVCGGTAIAISTSLNIKNANAELNLGSESLIAANNTLTSTNQVSTSKDETVYVITDDTGAAKSKFIGNTIYNGTDKLPFEFKVSYYLDGNEISAKDLKDKSGHVKIVYTYNSTAQYQGKYVPFMAVTGLTLDSNKFTNLKITSGKIISETADNYVIAGYSLTGLDANLGTDFLSDSFSVEADVTNFELGNTYTMFMNDIFADLDTSKLSDLDSLANSMTELSNGVDQIIAGAGTLSDGLASALDGAKTLYAGSTELTAGLTELRSHNEELVAGATKIKTLAPDIADLMQEKINTLKTQRDALEPCKAIEPYKTQYEQIVAGIAKLQAGLQALPGLNDLYDGIIDYTDGVSSALVGSAQITAGLGSLVDGTTQLYEGSVTLKDGLNTLKTTGIDKLVSFATNDLQKFTSNLRSTVNAAASYKNFGDNTTAKSVKFILKTPSI